MRQLVAEHLRTRVAPLVGWFERRGVVFWAMALALLGAFIYLPYLASYPLWDPWEPHYTQVAWEMSERHTWLVPWYRGEDNWWSKPILLLWMLRASLAVLWDPSISLAEIELAARLPFALAAIAGGVLHFDWVRRLYGVRVGVVAAVVLLTAPQYLLIGRQVMIDGPFATACAASLGYLAVGLFTPRPEITTTLRGGTSWRARIARDWPFAAFWVLQAVAVLAKGFVAPVLAVLTLAGYATVTFRWSDYAPLTAGRDWKRYIAIRGAAALALVALLLVALRALPREPRELHQLAAALTVLPIALVLGLGVFHDLPPARHALHLLVRIRATWGLALFFAVAAPWYGFMTAKYGWPYWKEFIFYHHLGRAAGTIDKPSNTFDYFVKQLAFGLFPWSAFAPVALWRLAGRLSAWRSIAERRNLYFFLGALLPTLFFSLSGTKFAHYIFPVVPMASVLLAVALVWLGQDEPGPIALAEEQPPVGAPVEAHGPARPPWWQKPGARGDLTIVAALTLVVFGVLCADLVASFRHFLRLFLYYANRATPPEYNPFVELQLVFFPIGLVLGTLLFTRWLGRRHLVGLGAGAVSLACYLAWVTLPAMGATYTYEPVLHAYERLARPGDRIGQYNDWQQPERSVLFLFQNRTAHLSSDAKTETFLREPGRKFIIVDSPRLPALRRAAKRVDTKLYVVDKSHPYALLVSNEPNADDLAKVATLLHEQLPATATPTHADLDGKLRLIGWEVDKPTAAPGDEVMVSLYFQTLQLVDEDWQVFVHAEGPTKGSRRIVHDHDPAGGVLPTTEWDQGQIVQDKFALRIPVGYSFEAMQLWVGMFIGERRMQVTPASASDSDNRIRGPRIPIDRGRP